MAQPSDFYARLEVHSWEKTDVIRKSYHRLALRFHPDKNAGSKVAKAQFQLVWRLVMLLIRRGTDA